MLLLRPYVKDGQLISDNDDNWIILDHEISYLNKEIVKIKFNYDNDDKNKSILYGMNIVYKDIRITLLEKY